MLKNRLAFLKNLAVWTPQYFKSMFGYFSTFCVKEFKKGTTKHRSTCKLARKHFLKVHLFSTAWYINIAIEDKRLKIKSSEDNDNS